LDFSAKSSDCDHHVSLGGTSDATNAENLHQDYKVSEWRAVKSNQTFLLAINNFTRSTRYCILITKSFFRLDSVIEIQYRVERVKLVTADRKICVGFGGFSF